MTKLSVNINKIATLRNARGGHKPDPVKMAVDIQEYGADGITVHPRPDERHIRYADVYALKPIVTTEFNIEGNPNQKFIDMVLEIKPDQVTLVPDAENVLTSNAGWDCIKHQAHLSDLIRTFRDAGIRTSVFLDPDPKQAEAAAMTGTDRIELYTEAYAVGYKSNKQDAISAYVDTAKVAKSLGLGINAGHDLDLENLAYFAKNIDGLLEVSIGHALVADALYYGIENTVRMYQNRLDPSFELK